MRILIGRDWPAYNNTYMKIVSRVSQTSLWLIMQLFFIGVHLGPLVLK